MRWEPRLGVFVEFVECDDEADHGAALFKTIEASDELSSSLPAWS